MTASVLIIGCGYFSQFHRDAWMRIPGVRIAGLCDNDPARLETASGEIPDAKVFLDVDAALSTLKPAIIDIVTGPTTHKTLVAKAAATRALVVCQKPLADTYDEAVAVVEAAAQYQATLVVHENFRFMPWFLEAKRLIDDGTLGTPLSVSFQLRPGDGQGPNAYLARQPYFQKMPRFLIHETGIHLVDVFRNVMGEITGVFARLKRFNPVIAGEDAGYVVFEFASGAQGLFDGNRHVDHPAEDTRMTNGVLLLEGSRGRLRLDGFGRLWLKPHGAEEREHAYTWTKRGFGGDCVYSQCVHIADHVLKGTPLVNEGRAYLRNLEIEEAIYRSNAEGRFITV
jgi:D-apiose dehydrogenase